MPVLTMPPPKKDRPERPAMPPIPEPEGDEDSATVRVSAEVARICRWLKRMEKGKPTPAELIDWAGLQNLRARFAPYEAKVKLAEEIERKKQEELRQALEGETPE